MEIEIVKTQQTNDLCTARVKITSNHSTKSNNEIFEALESKIQELRKEMHKAVVSWTSQIEKQSKRVNVKAIKSTVAGKHQAVLVAFGADAKQRIAQIVAECKAAEEETKSTASEILDLQESKPQLHEA